MECGELFVMTTLEMLTLESLATVSALGKREDKLMLWKRWRDRQPYIDFVIFTFVVLTVQILCT